MKLTRRAGKRMRASLDCLCMTKWRMIRQNQFTFRHSIKNHSNLVELIEEHFALVLNIMPTVRTARFVKYVELKSSTNEKPNEST